MCCSIVSRSLVASYVSSEATSEASSRNSLVLMPARRISPSLCWIRGWWTSTIFMSRPDVSDGRDCGPRAATTHRRFGSHGIKKGAGNHRHPFNAQLHSVGCVRGIAQAGTHELLAGITFERLGLRIGVAGFHFFLLGHLGRRGNIALQAAAHELLAVVAAFASRLLVAIGHALLLRVLAGRGNGGVLGRGESGRSGEGQRYAGNYQA